VVRVVVSLPVNLNQFIIAYRVRTLENRPFCGVST